MTSSFAHGAVAGWVAAWVFIDFAGAGVIAWLRRDARRTRAAAALARQGRGPQ